MILIYTVLVMAFHATQDLSTAIKSSSNLQERIDFFTLHPDLLLQPCPKDALVTNMWYIDNNEDWYPGSVQQKEMFLLELWKIFYKAGGKVDEKLDDPLYGPPLWKACFHSSWKLFNL